METDRGSGRSLHPEKDGFDARLQWSDTGWQDAILKLGLGQRHGRSEGCPWHLGRGEP